MGLTGHATWKFPQAQARVQPPPSDSTTFVGLSARRFERDGTLFGADGLAVRGPRTQGFGVHHALNPDPYRGRFRCAAQPPALSKPPLPASVIRLNPLHHSAASSTSPQGRRRGVCRRRFRPAGHRNVGPRCCLRLGEHPGSERGCAARNGVPESNLREGAERAWRCKHSRSVRSLCLTMITWRALLPPCGQVREAGGLCVADEVQTGFGRTGTAYWGFQNHGVSGGSPLPSRLARCRW